MLSGQSNRVSLSTWRRPIFKRFISLVNSSCISYIELILQSKKRLRKNERRGRDVLKCTIYVEKCTMTVMEKREFPFFFRRKKRINREKRKCKDREKKLEQRKRRRSARGDPRGGGESKW